MQLPLKITFRNMESSPAIETDVGRYAARLERRFGRIMSCRVAIQAPHHHHRQGKLFRVSVDLKVPGREIAATSAGPKDHAHEDIHVAIRDVFDAVERRLQDHAREAQGAVKVHAPKTTRA
ncbi:MAG TPA: HPF/RaiA family ribosome-associated protein [Rhizomicrobium sp.]|nr:HPF/RaiA family ribosome-associated protein [Rhizomicrobium sp.]